MAGINIHATSLVFGGAALASLAKAYMDGGGGWNGFANIPGQLYNSGGLTDTGKAFAVGLGGYTLVRSVRKSLEPQPMFKTGKSGGLRLFLL